MSPGRENGAGEKAVRRGRIITFYSYKGGTGRSMMLANVAWILASRGKSVLALDWDLEAPGLHRYFHPFLPDPDLSSSEGVIDFVHKFVAAAAIPPSSKAPAGGAAADDEWVEPYANILRYAASLKWSFHGGGTLDFIPAGRQGPSYSTRINTFDWEHFYQELGGWRLLELARERMREEYDYILIDSRTGVSDTSGICTIDMPDALVVCFTLNNQGIEGAARVAGDVFEKRGGAGPAAEGQPADAAEAAAPPVAPVQIFPVPMRIENAEKAKLQARRAFAREKFRQFPTGLTPEEVEQYWSDVPVLYVPYFAYEEILAAFGDSPTDRFSILASAQHLTSYLSGGEVTKLGPVTEEERRKVLRAFEGGGAEADPAAEEERFAETAFGRLDAAEQATARRLLTRLVRVAEPGEVGGDTLLRINAKDFGKPQADFLRNMVRAGLVQHEEDDAGGEVFKLASDTLLTSWGRLRRWLDEDRIFLLWRQRLQVKVDDWERGGRDPGALLSGSPLAEARAILAGKRAEMSDAQVAFINLSTAEEARLRAEQERLRAERERLREEHESTSREADILKGKFQDNERRLRATFRWAAIGSFAVLALVTGLYYSNQMKQRADAQRDQSIQLTALARVSQDPELRLLLAAEAVRLDANDRTDSGLRDALSDFRQVAVLLGHTGSVRDAAYSPDGRLVVTAGSDGAAIIWEAAGDGWRQRHTLRGHSGNVSAAAFSPDAKLVATAGFDEQVLFFNADTGARLPVAMPKVSSVLDVSFSPDGKYLATGTSGNEANLYEHRGGAVYSFKAPLGLHSDNVNGVAFSPDGRLLASASTDNTVSLWDVQSRKLIAELKAHTQAVNSVAFSPDGRFLVSGSDDYTALVWVVATGRVAQPLRLSAEGVRSVAYSPDGGRIVTNDLGGAVVWDAATGQRRLTLEGHQGQVNSVAFSPDGTRVVTAGADRTARVWDVSESFSVGEPVAQLMGRVCQKVTRNLSPEEWVRYMGSEPYRKTCENLP